jgi:cytochrome c biogenesis protein CcdA
MQEWIDRIAGSDHVTFSVLAASFILGLIGSVTSCCNYAIIGAIAGYSGRIGVEKKTKMVWTSGLSFLIGTILSLAIIGGLAGYISNIISGSLGIWWKAIAGLLSVFFGLATLNWLPFKLPSVAVPGRSGGGFLASLFFGIAVGGISVICNSCCNPVFPVVLGATFIKGSFLWGLFFLCAFGLGYGIPMAAAMIGIGIGVGKISGTFSKITVIMKYVAGLLLLIAGFYFLWTLS